MTLSPIINFSVLSYENFRFHEICSPVLKMYEYLCKKEAKKEQDEVNIYNASILFERGYVQKLRSLHSTSFEYHTLNVYLNKIKITNESDALNSKSRDSRILYNVRNPQERIRSEIQHQ